ncbi:hypothetical protein ACQKGB_29135, partial [Bacillus tropicus]|uniref:hypothetical protein n=1 Tax=Bacillus tropicus TaxID=2026188 RepID=UPI003D03E42C
QEPTAITDDAAPTTVTAENVIAADQDGAAAHGAALYAGVCTGMLPFFSMMEELAAIAGEPWDPDRSAGEFVADLVSSDGSITQADIKGFPLALPRWSQLSAVDQAQVQRAVYAAAEGDC